MPGEIPELIPPEIATAGPTEPPAPALDRPQLSRVRHRWWRDALEMLALIVVIYSCVNLTTARAIVEGPSMQPTFYTGQLVIVNLFTYYFSAPARGDVVVLHNPYDQCKNVIRQNAGVLILLPNSATNDTCDDLIKRVIGLPGETIQIKAGHVSINGTPLDEPYTADHVCDQACNGRWPLGPNQYFVLGDNRNNSSDSRVFGPIDRSLIVGKAWVRYWPLPDVAVIPRPNYGPIMPTPSDSSASNTKQG